MLTYEKTALDRYRATPTPDRAGGALPRPGHDVSGAELLNGGAYVRNDALRERIAAEARRLRDEFYTQALARRPAGGSGSSSCPSAAQLAAHRQLQAAALQYVQFVTELFLGCYNIDG